MRRWKTLAVIALRPAGARPLFAMALLAAAVLLIIGTNPVPVAATDSDTDTAADPDLLRLHLMWTNDLHGHIAPEPARIMNPAFSPPLGGAASAAR